MADVIQILLFIIIGTGLLYFGYSLFFGFSPKKTISYYKTPQEGLPGDPRTCPVCSAKLAPGERVRSSAFPSMNGSDRLMHIYGCMYCLSGDRKRICPVCKATLAPQDVLVARLFDKPGRSHVHVLGCSRCRPSGISK
ncbi:MAG TPA: hypothetical protein PLB48_05630 [Treponema sp.]|jgi:RNase P subunit RPR2|uniref:hypothetical protein n=1 Tax=Gracilinema caldarium TaxID=215591 RepID=UPI001694F818|nr:hypothetical protein [Gracilinema caldarium]NLJ10664.1 hypothetical protein [Treponema sp.]HON13110.1 hypothetical protein [Treponema sp.]HPC71265.1 hypothetical protein [Treponema sp.]HRS04154.1 hypothetical protein [Treponema sp.]HRU28302.1 hypothetical protein [Treponema sp.]